MYLTVAFLAFMISVSSFAAEQSPHTVTSLESARQCESATMRLMNSDTAFSKPMSLDPNLATWTRNVVRLTCHLEAVRRVEEQIRDTQRRLQNALAKKYPKTVM